MGIWIAGVESDRALARFVGLNKVGFRTLRPTEKARVQDGERQRRGDTPSV
jgi:hypothetical protein